MVIDLLYKCMKIQFILARMMIRVKRSFKKIKQCSKEKTCFANMLGFMNINMVKICEENHLLNVCYFPVVKDFVLIGQHTCPKTAMKEIDELYGVVKQIHKKWKIDVGSTTTLLSVSLVNSVQFLSTTSFKLVSFLHTESS